MSEKLNQILKISAESALLKKIFNILPSFKRVSTSRLRSTLRNDEIVSEENYSGKEAAPWNL